MMILIARDVKIGVYLSNNISYIVNHISDKSHIPQGRRELTYTLLYSLYINTSMYIHVFTMNIYNTSSAVM